MKRNRRLFVALFMLMVVELFCFICISTVSAGQSIPIDLTSAQVSVNGLDSIKIDNIKIPGYSGTYWAKFRWDPNAYIFEIIDAGVSSTQSQSLRNYTWHIDMAGMESSALVSFTVSGDKIEGTVTSSGPQAFMVDPSFFTATQNSRQLTFSPSPLIDSNSAVMTSPEEGDFWLNGSLNSGAMIHFTMSSFPNWFSLNEPFKLCYFNGSCFNVSP